MSDLEELRRAVRALRSTRRPAAVLRTLESETRTYAPARVAEMKMGGISILRTRGAIRQPVPSWQKQRQRYSVQR